MEIIEEFRYDQGPPASRYIEGLKRAVSNCSLYNQSVNPTPGG